MNARDRTNASGGRPVGRIAAMLLALPFLALAACGDETTTPPGDSEPVDVGAQPTTPERRQGEPLDPGPAEIDPADVSPDELVIKSTGAITGPDLAAVTASGGEIVFSADRLGLHVARFEVADLGALLVVRDELRSMGVDAAVSIVSENPAAGPARS